MRIACKTVEIFTKLWYNERKRSKSYDLLLFLFVKVLGDSQGAFFQKAPTNKADIAAYLTDTQKSATISPFYDEGV